MAVGSNAPIDSAGCSTMYQCVTYCLSSCLAQGLTWDIDGLDLFGSQHAYGAKGPPCRVESFPGTRAGSATKVQFSCASNQGSNNISPAAHLCGPLLQEATPICCSQLGCRRPLRAAQRRGYATSDRDRR